MIWTKKIINLFLSFFVLSFLLVAASCSHSSSPLKKGVWRASLQRADGQQVVFNFEIADSADRPVMYVFNANERMPVDSITFYKDSVRIQMPFFDSYFLAKINKDGSLQGTWTKNYGSRSEQMPFHAFPGDSLRLPVYKPASYDVSGSWAASFPRGAKDTSHAIGLFQQEGANVTGTFLTPVGDYRYLQGVVSGDTLKLSGFDGCHALLFTALVDSAGSLSQGELYSINSKVQSWQAEKKTYDSLPAAYAVSTIKPGTVRPAFSLEDIRTGKKVSSTDNEFKDKVVVVQILGSWCPNCMDETAFLTKYYEENKQRGFAIVGVAFERTSDLEKSKEALQSFFDHFDIQYPVLFSGVALSDPKMTEKVFPNLPEPIDAFPTTIFIDKSGYIRKIHKGFNGPATGKYYTEFQHEFSAIVNDLLAEK